MRIFAEIVDASALSVDAIVERARAMRAVGADVIDLGCLPDTPFPHLADAVRALVGEGFAVSVDSAQSDELRTGARAGATFLLSLTEHTLDLARETGATPVLVPAEHGDLASLLRAAEAADKAGIAALLDPILDPIHFGFMESLSRYAELRARLPEAEILMGTGNLTELTDADSGGVTAALLGICSELAIRNVLVVQVSPHTRRTFQEHDAARRMMFAARADDSLPQGYGGALLQLHDRKPFPNTSEEIAALAARGARRQFPHRGRRGRHPRLCARRAPCRHRRAVAVPEARAGPTMRACLLSGRRAAEGGDRLAAGQALRAGRAARLGLSAPTGRRRTCRGCARRGIQCVAARPGRTSPIIMSRGRWRGPAAARPNNNEWGPDAARRRGPVSGRIIMSAVRAGRRGGEADTYIMSGPAARPAAAGRPPCR